jgi:DivIVA domain-containing protein
LKLDFTDISHQEFKRAFRGYDPHEVSAFLEVVAEKYTELLQQNNELLGKLKAAEDELTQKKALLEEHERNLQSYKNEMSKVEHLMDLKLDADIIVQKARTEAGKLITEAQKQSEQVRSETKLLQDQRAKVAAHLREYLRSQMTLLGIMTDNDSTVELSGASEPEKLKTLDVPEITESLTEQKNETTKEIKLELVDPESIDTFLSDVELDDIPQELAHALTRFNEEYPADSVDENKKQQMLKDLDALAEQATGMFRKADFHKMLGNDIHKRSEEMINQIYAELEKKKYKDNSNPKEPS